MRWALKRLLFHSLHEFFYGTYYFTTGNCGTAKSVAVNYKGKEPIAWGNICMSKPINIGELV